MKYAFLAIFVALLALSLVAWAIAPRAVRDGRTVLVWTVDDNESRKEQAALFERTYPKYDLRIDQSNMDLSKVIVQSLGGVGPDLFCSYSGFHLSAYVKSGIAWDLTEELERLGIELDDLWNGPFPCMIYDGRVYGIGNNAGVDAVWYNKDLFDAQGIPYPAGPWQWEAFVPLAQRLTLRDESGRVVQFGFMFEWYRWPQFVRQWGGRVFTEDGTRCVLDSPQAVAAVRFMQDLVHKYRVSPSPEQEAGMTVQGGWGAGTIRWFGAGRAAMALGGRWWLIALRQYEGLRLGAVEAPHALHRVFLSYGKATLINRKSPRRREALDFLRYMTTRDYNDLIAHQADALGPVKAFAYSETFLHDPAYPEEDYNHVWRDVMQYGVPEETSLFINGAVANRLINEQLDLVKNNSKTPAAAMRDAARKINQEIKKTLAREPELRERYDELRAAARRDGGHAPL